MKEEANVRSVGVPSDQARDRRIGRRTFLTSAMALAATSALPAGTRTALAAGAPVDNCESVEQKVYLDYTQDQLDRAYDQFAWAPNGEKIIERYTSESEAAAACLEQRSLSYGPTSEETLTVFPSARQNAPIHVFVHGGAWQQLTAEDSYFPAPIFVDAGAHYVAVNFAKIPDVRLPDMADQVRRAVAWLYNNAKSFDGNPDQIYVSGHSSGAHLVGVLLTTEWEQYGVPETVIKGGFPVSGMFDLRPVLLSARSSFLKLSSSEEDALSPIRHLERISCPVTVSYGEEESPEFKRQSLCFASALENARHPAGLIVLPRTNHFEAILSMSQESGILAHAALRQMGLTPRARSAVTR